MKLLIASDIHGSAKYCRQLLEMYDKEGADKLILLGDILYHGPRNDLPDEYGPKSVIKMLNERKQDIMCVRGNCDTEVDQMVLEFPILSEEGIIFIDNHTFVLAHGHKLAGASKPALRNGDILICGHTHVPKAEKQPVDAENELGGSYLYINPGSVSIPKEGSRRGYILYENETFTMKDLFGEVRQMIGIQEYL